MIKTLISFLLTAPLASALTAWWLTRLLARHEDDATECFNRAVPSGLEVAAS